MVLKSQKALFLGVISFIMFYFYFNVAEYLLKMDRFSAVFNGHKHQKKLKFFIDHGTYVPPTTNITLYEIIHMPKENVEDVDIVFGLRTVQKKRELRNKIRRSFGNRDLYKEFFKVKVVFLLGRVENVPDDSIVEELEEHDDIVYGSFQDSYWNLTFKDSMLFTWTEQNAPNIKFVYKGDDDNFLNPVGLISFFKEHWNFAIDQPALWGALYPKMPTPFSSPENNLTEIRADRRADIKGIKGIHYFAIKAVKYRHYTDKLTSFNLINTRLIPFLYNTGIILVQIRNIYSITLNTDTIPVEYKNIIHW